MTRNLGSLMVMLALFVGLAASPAQAADELGLSWDGHHWSDHLKGSLFDESVRWVPGDERSNDFYVRNNADDGAVLTIAVESRDQDRLLRNDDLSLAARVSGSDWIALERTGEAFRLRQGALQAGESDRVQVRASFDPASTNRSQRDELSLDFQVTLTDADGSNTDDPGDDENGGNGLLPDTGAPQVGWLIVLGGVMLGVGLALLRRRREEASHG